MSKNTEIRARITANGLEFNRAIDGAQRKAGEFKRSLESGGGSIRSALGGYIAGFGILSGAIESVKEAANFDSLVQALGAVGDQSISVSTKLAALRETAKLPGLGFEEAVSGALKLQGAGMTFAQSKQTLEQWGNALAAVGGGKEDLSGIVKALGDMASKGGVFQEEINQIGERLPTIRVLMKEAFGTASSEELQKLNITAEEFFAGMSVPLGKLAKVSGGMKNDWENLGDIGKRVLVSIGGYVDFLSTPLKKAAEATGEWFLGSEKTKGSIGEIGNAAVRTREQIEADARATKELAENSKAAADAAKARAEMIMGLRGGDAGIGGLNRIREAGVTDENERLGVLRSNLRVTEQTVGSTAELVAKIKAAREAGQWVEMARLVKFLDESKRLTSEIGEIEKKQAEETKRITDEEKQAADERAQKNRDQIDSVREMVDLRDTLIEKEKQITAEAEKQRQFRRDFAEDSRIEQLRGQGRNRQADRMERDKRIEQSKRALIEQGGMSPADAEKEARRAERSRNGRITTNERQRRPEFGALDEFNNRQKGRFDPLAEDAKKNADKKNRRNKVDVQEKAQTESEKQLGALVKAVESIQKSIDQASKKKGMEAVN